jgi:ElaB/YqjD/DUF883 family membrane-anchored ribosome-binding protein
MAKKASMKRIVKTAAKNAANKGMSTAKKVGRITEREFDKNMRSMDEVSRALSGAVSTTKGTINSAKKLMRSDFKKARVTLAKAQKTTESYIHKNPKKAAAIAAGVGAAIGAAIIAYMAKQKAGGARR